jgi:hypothetical protein
MKTRRLKELLAIMSIGDGLLTAIDPQRHLSLWKIGPKACVGTVEALLRHPNLTRVLGIVATAASFWWASRQTPTAIHLRRTA